MKDDEKVAQSAMLISKHFGISQSEFGLEEQSKPDYTLLLKELTRVVRYLLDHDFQKLLNGLYRIDVNEAKVSHILEITPSEEIAGEIAKLIIERELMKVETRLKYRQN